jgi:hypothetical protein
MAAAMLMPAMVDQPTYSQAAAVVVSQPVAVSDPAPAKPMAEGVDEDEVRLQKCHIKFFPLIRVDLDDTDLVQLEIIVDVDCREEIGLVQLFAESRLIEELDGVLDDAVTLTGTTIVDEDALDAGFCVDVEVESWVGHETHWGQCFYDEDEILSTDSW